MPTGVRVAGLLWDNEALSGWIGGLRSRESHAWHHISGKKPKAEKVIGFWVEHAVVILLNGHTVKLPSGYL